MASDTWREKMRSYNVSEARIERVIANNREFFGPCAKCDLWDGHIPEHRVVAGIDWTDEEYRAAVQHSIGRAYEEDGDA